MRMVVEIFGEEVGVETEESKADLEALGREIEGRAQTLGPHVPTVRLAAALAFSYAYEAHKSRETADDRSRALLSESAAHSETRTRCEWATKGRADAEARLQEALEVAAQREEMLVKKILELEIRTRDRARAVRKRAMIARTRRITRKAA